MIFKRCTANPGNWAIRKTGARLVGIVMLNNNTVNENFSCPGIMVFSVYSLLATGAHHADCVSIYLAAVTTIQNCWVHH